MDPFRDDDHAALIRAARLEEENERLRRELEEARRPKPEPKSKPKRRFVLLYVIGGAAIATMIVAVVAARSRPTATSVVVQPKTLEVPSVPPTPPPPSPSDWAAVAKIPVVDLRGYAQGYSPNVGYAVGKGGAILRHFASEDSSGWTVETSGTTEDLNAVVSQSDHVTCAVGTAGVAVCADSAKGVWKRDTTGTHNELLGVGLTEDSDIVAVGREGTILRRNPSGWWTPEASGTKADLFAVDAPYAVGAGGIILRREAHAAKWSVVASGTVEDLYALDVQTHAVVVVGARGTILRMTDPRDGFRVEPSHSTHDLFGVARGKAGYDFIAVGASGTILHSMSPTSGWSAETGGGAHDLHGVLGSVPVMFIVGDSGAILSRRW